MIESQLILASQSPRRASLLEQMGFQFQIVTQPVIEDDVENLGPEDHVRILSQRKADAILNQIESGVIIGADTIVHYNDQIMGKPTNSDEAFEMLSLLSGNTHQVYTGVTLLEVDGKGLTDVVCTDVTFRTLSDWEMKDYIATGGPLDKAGAYGIQEQAGLFVSKINGCYFNVVGFPLSRFFEMLQIIWDMERIRKLFTHSYKSK